MQKVFFTNDGEIDLLSISSFGVSVKEGDSPIGFFGTGLKYAIAVILRHEQKISCYIGKMKVKFSLVKKQVRGKEFAFIGMQCDEGSIETLGFTTELGKNWELWMAYREIACNCKDEGGSVSFDQKEPLQGKTIFEVSGDKFHAIACNAGAFILDDLPDFKIHNMEVRCRGSNGFFYRGVKIQEFSKPWMHTFNETESIELTEDRTAKNQSMPAYRVAMKLMQSNNKNMLRRCLTAKDDYMESHLDFHGWSHISPSSEFLEVVGACYSEKITSVNKTAIRVWEESTKKDFYPMEVQLTKVQKATLFKAVEFCKTIGFPVDHYPIQIVESLGSGTLGLAKDEKIYIAEQVLISGGTKQLASTLIEEYVHLRHGWHDLTRELQSFLFEKVVSLGEELSGEPL